MIKLPTLLILGAGASMPYGFPSGAVLRRKICEGIPGEAEARLFDYFRDGPEDAKSFRREFKNSELYSIDRFLNQRPEFSKLGKLAIALVLSNSERASNRHEAINGHYHWYQYLWNQLIDGTKNLGENNLRVITFNYDRSLEHYLAAAYASTYSKSYEEALEQVEATIPIRHMYGQLGKLAKFADTAKKTLNYGAELNGSTAEIALSGIRTMHERDLDDASLEQIKNDIRWAARVAFLGFSYDSINMERLNLGLLNEKPANVSRRYVQVFGTCKGLQGAEVTQAIERIRTVDVPVELEDEDSEILLRKHGVFF